MTLYREVHDLLIEWGVSKAEIAAIPRRRSMLRLLRAIDAEAKAVYGDAGAWLRWPNRSAMFRGRAPLLTVLEGEPGMLVVLGHPQRMNCGGVLAEQRNGQLVGNRRWKRRGQ